MVNIMRDFILVFIKMMRRVVISSMLYSPWVSSLYLTSSRQQRGVYIPLNMHFIKHCPPDWHQCHRSRPRTIQMVKTFESTSIRHRSDAKVSDRYLIHVDPRVYVNWVGLRVQRNVRHSSFTDCQFGIVTFSPGMIDMDDRRLVILCHTLL